MRVGKGRGSLVGRKDVEEPTWTQDAYRVLVTTLLCADTVGNLRERLRRDYAWTCLEWTAADCSRFVFSGCSGCARDARHQKLGGGGVIREQTAGCAAHGSHEVV